MRTQYYDPFIEAETTQQVQMRGFPVTISGTYVLLDDVVTVLRQFAQSLEDPDDGALVHQVATWLISGEMPEFEARSVPEVEQPYEVHGAEADDVTPDVDRVEIYPTDDGSGRRKWYARTIDTGGNVMKVSHGNFDRTWVETNAEERWPGVPMYEVSHENERSMWKERGERGYKHGLYPTAGAR